MSISTDRIGLSITEDKVQLVEILEKDNQFLLENVDEEYFEEPLFDHTKESKFIHILQNAFNELILRKALNSKNIYISLPQTYFKIFEIPVDKNLTKNDMNDYIQWELSKLFPSEAINHFSFQNIILNTLGYEAAKRVLVYAIPIDILKRIHKFCVRNNLQLKKIDSSHAAATSLLYEDETTFNLSIYIENNNLSMLLLSNNKVIIENNFNYESVSDIPKIINSFIEELTTRELISQKIDKIFVFGISGKKELKQSVEDLTSISIKEINPFEKLEINPDLENRVVVTTHYQNFSSAVAVALCSGS